MLASELTDTTAEDYGLWPSYSPWWYDLVDKENVANDGEGVYVAVLDTGLMDLWPFFFPEGDIAWELGKGFSHDIWWDDTYGVVMSELKDDRGFITDLASGHGTHVTSTIIGFNYNNYYYVEGIAPKATIIPVLVLDAWEVDSPMGLLQFSGGTDEMISAGIYYIADLAGELDGPVIINMSLGGPSPTVMIEEAINYAIAKGVIVVVSAGNEGEAGMDYPGAYDQVISTAACGWTEALYHTFWYPGDRWLTDVPEELNVPDVFGNEYQVYLEDFSGRPNADLGQKHHHLDVMAPGAWIVGPYKPTFTQDVGYWYVSGTSMAAPHVSAIAALILEDYPYFDQKDIEHILKIAAGGVGQNMLRGFPKEATDVLVAYVPGYVYVVSWGRHDYGRGFLQCDEALFYAAHYKVGYSK
jgi:subtilisin family serine protease